MAVYLSWPTCLDHDSDTPIPVVVACLCVRHLPGAVAGRCYGTQTRLNFPTTVTTSNRPLRNN